MKNMKYKIAYVAAIIKRTVRTLENWEKKKKIKPFYRDISGRRYTDEKGLENMKNIVVS